MIVDRENMMRCYICRLKSEGKVNIEEANIECPRCGRYWIRSRTPDILIGELSEPQIANISYWIRHNQAPDEVPVINPQNINFLRSLYTPTVGEKALRFILYFSKLKPIPGTYIKKDVSGPNFLSEFGFTNFGEVEFIVNSYLRDEKKYIDGSFDRDMNVSFKITPAGWAYIESLKDINPESQIGFIAMWFDDTMNTFLEVLRQAISDAGYIPRRVNDLEHNDDINDKIISSIRQSRFVVADFTKQRAGVYFESGYAKGLGLDVIWLCREDDFNNKRWSPNVGQFRG